MGVPTHRRRVHGQASRCRTHCWGLYLLAWGCGKPTMQPCVIVPDSNALQLAPHTPAVEEEPVLLECGLCDVKEGPQQLHHVGVHQPEQELGQDPLPQTVLCGRDIATPWKEKDMESSVTHPTPVTSPRPTMSNGAATGHQKHGRADPGCAVHLTQVPNPRDTSTDST